MKTNTRNEILHLTFHVWMADESETEPEISASHSTVLFVCSKGTLWEMKRLIAILKKKKKNANSKDATSHNTSMLP